MQGEPGFPPSPPLPGPPPCPVTQQEQLLQPRPYYRLSGLYRVDLAAASDSTAMQAMLRCPSGPALGRTPAVQASCRWWLVWGQRAAGAEPGELV